LRADAISFDTIFHTEENKKIIKSVEEFYHPCQKTPSSYVGDE
jgi:hypothetical protein